MADEIFIRKTDLNSPTKFRQSVTNLVPTIQQQILDSTGVFLDNATISDLMLAECRLRFDKFTKTGERKRKTLDKEKILARVQEYLCETIVALPLNDPDILRLLIFCIEITEQMFEGGTRATTAAKSFREKQRRYEEILVAQFIGKLGEVFLKRYLENRFPEANIQLDWEISPDREKYVSDIINAQHRVSVKSSPSLAGIWAEADLNSDYGIMVKCVVPRATLIQFFIEVCGYTRLLDFADQGIPADDDLFRTYLNNIRERVQQYKCGTVKTNLIDFVCGYFRTSEHQPVEEGEKLAYLGEVREKRYLVKLSDLHWSQDDWLQFLQENSLLNQQESF